MKLKKLKYFLGLPSQGSIDAGAIGIQEQDRSFFAVLNSSIPILIAVYILIKPLPISAVNEICFYASLFSLVILIAFKKKAFSMRSPLTLPFALFFIWAILGLFFTIDFGNTLHDLRAHLFNYLLIFFILINYFNSTKRLDVISLVLVASGVIFSVASFAGFYLVDGNSFSARLGLGFREMNPCYIGFTTITAAIFSLYHFNKAELIRSKVFFLLCFLIVSTATLLTQSRGALLALTLTLILLSFTKKKNLIFVLSALLLFFILPGMKNRAAELGFQQDIRTSINRLTLDVIKTYPIAGVGYGMGIYGNKIDLKKFNSSLPLEYRQQGEIYRSPHNTFLEITVRMGIVGLILFIFMFLTAFKMLWDIFRRRTDAALNTWAVYLAAAFFSFIFQALFNEATFGARAIIFYSLLAMISIAWNLHRNAIASVPASPPQDPA